MSKFKYVIGPNVSVERLIFLKIDNNFGTSARNQRYFLKNTLYNKVEEVWDCM